MSAAVSRVKKIIRLDDDVAGCSNSAAFLVTIAAVCFPSLCACVRVCVCDGEVLTMYGDAQEMFVQYLAEQGLKMTHGDRKQRKTMQYKDLGMMSPSCHLPRATITDN